VPALQSTADTSANVGDFSAELNRCVQQGWLVRHGEIATLVPMSHYTAEVRWIRGDQVFTDNRYSREHRWRFDGGIEVPASSSPQVVAKPFSVENAVDPEEAFVASLSSCHMLWFLSLAAKEGLVVDTYVDAAEGVMGKNSDGRLAMLTVTLRPRVAFGGARQPNAEEIGRLHHRAHDACFIANSVRTDVRCEPQL
jgi:organic hydroperoxide reductase OsmC/OhrA